MIQWKVFLEIGSELALGFGVHLWFTPAAPWAEPHCEAEAAVREVLPPRCADAGDLREALQKLRLLLHAGRLLS